MKLTLTFALVILAVISQAQTGTQDNPDLVVLKFSCGNYKTGSGMIRSVQDPDPPKNEPIRINQSARNEPQEVKNRRDMLERRADMTAAEINAGLSSRHNPRLYFYRLRVKNASTKIVKSFAWEYQPLSQPNPSDRQFFCNIKAKPSESKDIELFTPLSPSWVVEASQAGNKSANIIEKVVINKIVYMDGTVWQRKAWNAKTFTDEVVQKVAEGKCVGL